MRLQRPFLHPSNTKHTSPGFWSCNAKHIERQFSPSALFVRESGRTRTDFSGDQRDASFRTVSRTKPERTLPDDRTSQENAFPCADNPLALGFFSVLAFASRGKISTL